MPDTKIRAPRATDILKKDHERVKSLFSEYEEFGDDSALTKQGIYEAVLHELSVHARIEEEIFYPAVAELGGTEDAAGTVEEALEEHRIVRALLSELSLVPPGSLDFDASMQALEESVGRHVEEEEKEIFTLFDKLDPEKRAEVSEALWRRKAELSQGTAEEEQGTA